MSAKNHLTEEQKSLTFELFKQGLKPARIADATSVKVKTIYTLLSRSISRGSTKRVTGTGKWTKMTPRVLRILRREVLYNRRATLAELASSLPVEVSTCTVRRALHKMRFQNRVAQKKPFMNAMHRKRRLDFARKYAHWTAQDWKKVIWTDESSFENGKNSAVVKVWRQAHEKYLEECLVPSFKSGRTSVMVWGAIRSGSKSELLFLGDEEHMGPGFASSVYEGPLARFYGLERDLILMEDDSPVHKSIFAKGVENRERS